VVKNNTKEIIETSDLKTDTFELYNGDCGFCLNNSNALREFEENE
jgi:hypothetical protein